MKKIEQIILLFVVTLGFVACCAKAAQDNAQPQSPVDKVLLKDFQPVVINNIPVTEVKRAKFDIIDMHSHDYVENVEQIEE